MAHTPIIIDSDIFVALFISGDVHHERAARLIDELDQKVIAPIVTSAVVGEVCSLLSRRVSQGVACEFLKFVRESELQSYALTPQDHESTLQLFSEQRFITSYTDCANVVVARLLQLPQILSFDKGYPKLFRLPLYS